MPEVNEKAVSENRVASQKTYLGQDDYVPSGFGAVVVVRLQLSADNVLDLFLRFNGQFADALSAALVLLPPLG